MYNAGKVPPHISSLMYCSQGAYLIGFPTLDTVDSIVESKQDFYEQKSKPSITHFKLFPKPNIKSSHKLTGVLAENIPMIAQQFQYEQDYEPQITSRKKTTSKTNISENEISILKKHPLYRLYSPANPVLKEEYSVLYCEHFKRLHSKDDDEILREKVKEWIDIGYHIHVVQAFKIEHQQGKPHIFLEKLKGRTLRDWIHDGFFEDKNKYLNSKRMLNCLLQVAVGLNYIHKRHCTHQELIPDYIFVENERILKIGNICGVNPVMGRINKNVCVGGSPEYWSPEQGSIYDNVKERAQDGGYQVAMKIVPALTYKSDLYQLGLIILELLFSKRLYHRGDKVVLSEVKDRQAESNGNKDTTSFMLEKAEEFLAVKPEERDSLKNFIVALLDFYAKHFKNAEDLLWVKFFDEEKYESDLLNNKAVGLYLSGNEVESEKAWKKSIYGNQQNLTAQFNFSHFKRMKRIIDDKKLNKDLMLLPQSRKRNYYQLISNLVMIPLLKEPFKTYNFNPKFSKHKQIQVLSNIIQTLQKFKKAKDYCFQRKYHLNNFQFQQGYIIQQYFMGRVRASNRFLAFKINQDIKSHSYIQINPREPSPPEGRQAHTAINLTNEYLAISDNSYLCIFRIKPLEDNQLYMEIPDYASAITTIAFDQRSQVLGVGSSQFTIKLINLTSKTIWKTINIGQKFIVKNLDYYDRNTCISYSYEKSITFHRIQSTKNLFTIRTNALVVSYIILEVTLTSHLLIVHTTEKFQIWNLKDKILIRNIEIDQAPKIQGFFANSAKKLVMHYTSNVIRIWNYSNGLILKTYRTPIPLSWVHMSPDFQYLRSLDCQGNFITRFVDFSEFIKFFQGVCIPNQICVTDDREQFNEDITLYIKYGRELIENLNDYRLNEQEKKVSLEKMYRIAETIKTSLFFQDKEDIKVIFQYLNGIKQAEDRSSRINSHSQEYIFTPHKQEFVTAVSNVCEGHWLIGESDGSIRLVSAPDTMHFSIKPKNLSISFLQLQATSIFIGYHSHCLLLQRDTLNIIVSHSAYHKKPVKMGLIVNNVLVTGDQDQLILFWNKDKVRRYQIPVSRGEIVGKKLIVAGYDNRVRLYDIHSENGLQKVHVFVGHVMNIYKMTVIDDGIFTTYSYDGSIRWWNTQVKSCFSFFNFKKYFRNDKILCVDLPKFSLEEEKHAKFNREGCALLLINCSEVVVFDTMRKEVKWRLEFAEEVTKVFWTDYPNAFAAVTHEEVIITNVYWRYMVLKKQ